ncbi:hypothetical protein ABTG83_20040, partial [Acinetobacter baumannii]
MLGGHVAMKVFAGFIISLGALAATGGVAGRGAEAGRQVLLGQHGAAGQRDAALDDVLQLAHLARVIVGAQ